MIYRKERTSPAPELGSCPQRTRPEGGEQGARTEALRALSERYPAFREAYGKDKVGHHLLVARSDDLPKEDAFELVAASAERHRALGYSYMVTEATNQWTGATFEALGGVGVHFYPFSGRSRPFARAPSRLRASRGALTGSSRTRTAGACST